MERVTGYTSSAKFKCLEDIQGESVELSLDYCGWEYCDPGHRFGPNKRNSHVLHVVKSGCGRLEMNHRIYELKTGDAFLIPSEQEAWYQADAEDPWCYMWIGFRGVKAWECIDNSGFSLQQPVRTVGCVSQLTEYVDKILEEYQLSYECDLMRKAYLMMFFAALVSDYKKQLPGTVHFYPGSVYVKYAEDYIKGHFSEKLKINDLASYIGVSRSYLTSSFRKVRGCSPQEFLVNLRLEKAGSMLRKTDIPINAVAGAVGYADQLAFSKMFKKYYKMSPKEYRKMKEELQICSEKGEYETQIGL